ncbi:MAG: T9SS type A sorting domain-containing protein [Bacteroidota bacterium]
MKKDSFEKKLAAYVATAAAFLAAQKESNAQIVYTNVNPDHLIDNSFFNLDLNNDGVTDYQFHIETIQGGSSGGFYGNLHTIIVSHLDPLSNNEIIGNPISKLNAGDTITPNNNWDQNHVLFYQHFYESWGQSTYGQSWGNSGSTFSGNWATADNNYVGLRIKVGSDYYYGWARLTVGLTLLDYAYYNAPNHTILAGETDCTNNIPSIVATPDTVVCGAATVTLSVPQQVSDSIRWSDGSTDFGAGAYQVPVNQSGSYYAIFTYPLCTDTAAVSIHIFSAGASLSQIHSTSCDSTAFINLTLNGGTPPFTYLWNTGSNQQDLNNLPQGNYSVTVTDSNGCNTSMAVQIPDVSFVLSEAHTISCDNIDSIDLAVNPISFQYSYLWNTGSTQQDLNSILPGNYSVTVSESNGCSNSIAITIDSMSIPQPLINQIGNILSTDSFNSYQWFLMSSPIGGAINQQYTPIQNGLYRVQVTDTNGCTGFSNYFTFINNSVDDIQSSEIQISIADKKLYLTDNALMGAQIDIVNELGQLAASVTVTNQNPSADLSALPGGIYFYQIRSKQKTYSGKFIIE